MIFSAKQTMYALLVIPAVLILISGSVSAQTDTELFKAPNNYRVTKSQVEGAAIQVFPRPPANGRDYFCAAADYAIRFLGARSSDRLVVVVPEAPRTSATESQSVHFSIVPRSEAMELPASQVQVNPRRVGENQGVGAAHHFCFRRSRSKRR